MLNIADSSTVFTKLSTYLLHPRRTPLRALRDLVLDARDEVRLGPEHLDALAALQDALPQHVLGDLNERGERVSVTRKPWQTMKSD